MRKGVADLAVGEKRRLTPATVEKFFAQLKKKDVSSDLVHGSDRIKLPY